MLRRFLIWMGRWMPIAVDGEEVFFDAEMQADPWESKLFFVARGERCGLAAAGD